VSDSEPELGLGLILKAEHGRVEVFFPAANEQRQYALKSAPLRRVQFKEGDRIRTHDGARLVVEGWEEQNGLLVYRCCERKIAETELADTISFSTPEDRLLAGQVDELSAFNLRAEALDWRARIRQSSLRGYVGGRVDLIPHQMYIVGEAASRLRPRVLLADEVGLGKTIEAGLILHRLHLTGRAERILILVPEPLVHQWFVEMLRRFNLLFSIYDEERCEALIANDPEANPFLDSQLVLGSIEWFANQSGRGVQAVEAGWDLLVVDEAHHLEWSPGVPSAAYRFVEALAVKTPGLLLLTATPQQLGPEGHFARLRLLDPERYASIERFAEESEHYEQVARAIDRVLAGKSPSKADRSLFSARSPRIRKHAEALAEGDETARTRLVVELLDEFGTGRVMFRNTRAALSGFPERRAKLVPLKAGCDESVLVKVRWLAGLLRELGEEKVLLICRTKELAGAVHELLLREMNVNAGLFHEELTLLQRDRNAAYFAEKEGARILICSEIGSEGRNFQFVHHLVLFDLPEHPELLEQRIGRLDRIGQKAAIQIYVPFCEGSAEEVLARWYHEGFGAFERTPHGASEILAAQAERLAEVCREFDRAKLEQFIRDTRELLARVERKLERGHDRLLELNSCKPEKARVLIEGICAADADAAFERFCVRILDYFGVAIEEMSARSYILRPGHVLTDAFPSMPEEGMSVTFDRSRALSREDLGFMTWDHPLVRSALDLLLGSEMGNSAFAIWKGDGGEAIFLDALLVVECVAPAALHVDRFLPATPVRVVVDHRLQEASIEGLPGDAALEKGDIFRLLDRGAVKKKLLPAMLQRAEALAEERMQGLVLKAVGAMDSQLQDEIERLVDLAQLNDHVPPDEIEGLKREQAALRQALTDARVRLDAVRLIFRIPAGS
jgi:ATP-dependent helicase HepA